MKERILKHMHPEPMSGCWLWTSVLSRDGYAKVGVAPDRHGPAHRVAYELWRGPIPAGLQIDHKCRVRSCVNPDHLEAVTCRENVLRSAGLAARNALRTHCLRGHPLSGDNLRVRDHGRRACRACERFRDRRNYWRAKEAKTWAA